MKLKRYFTMFLALALVFVGFHAEGMTVSAAEGTGGVNTGTYEQMEDSDAAIAAAADESASPAPSESAAPDESASPAPGESVAPGESTSPAPGESAAPGESTSPEPGETETPETDEPAPDTDISWELEDGTLTISGVGEMGTLSGFDKDQVTSVVIEEGVTSIGMGAFSNCKSLKSVAIPKSVTSIGGNAFFGCSALESVTIPNSVVSISWNAFSDCSSLKSVTIPDSVTSIGGGAFSSCSSLTSVTISNNITSITWGMFSGCSALTSVAIPNSVTWIGAYAFADCSALASVTIRDSVTSIGECAFEGCRSLISIMIPDSVTSIEHNAFDGCRSLKSVSLPKVTTIEYMTFANCTSLAQVEIPDSVKAIEYQAFANCASLSSVMFKGDAPELAVRSIDLSDADNDPKDYAGFIFQGVTATVCYPLDNATWTSEVKQKFGEGAHLAWARGDSSYAMDPVSIDLIYKAGSRGGLTFRCYHSLDDFVSATVDGKVLDPSNYKVEEGSTRLVIVSEFLDKLSPGEHTLTINYEGDCSVDVHFYIQRTNSAAGTPATPGSGDSLNNTSDGNSTSGGKTSFDYTYKTGEKTGIDNIILIICGICMMGCLFKLYMNKKHE